MSTSRPLTALLAFVIAACGATTDPAAGLLADEGTLTIQTTQSRYDWPAGTGTGPAIQATVTNNGSTAVYARLGDAFNSAEEQDLLFAVTSSDGRVERQSGDSWVTLPGGVLFEGFKTVVLRPGRTYTLIAHLEAPRVTGQARIRITWFASAAEVGTGAGHDDVSNTFELR